MAVMYNRDRAIALYNQSLQNGRFTIAYGFHHMLRAGDRPASCFNHALTSRQHGLAGFSTKVVAFVWTVSRVIIPSSSRVAIPIIRHA